MQEILTSTSSRPAGLPASSKQGTTISDCMTLIELQCTSVKNWKIRLVKLLMVCHHISAATTAAWSYDSDHRHQMTERWESKNDDGKRGISPLPPQFKVLKFGSTEVVVVISIVAALLHWLLRLWVHRHGCPDIRLLLLTNLRLCLLRYWSLVKLRCSGDIPVETFAIIILRFSSLMRAQAKSSDVGDHSLLLFHGVQWRKHTRLTNLRLCLLRYGDIPLKVLPT